MPFAIVLALVVLISTAVLLHQYWTGELADDGAEGLQGAPRSTHPHDGPTRAHAHYRRIDHAA